MFACMDSESLSESRYKKPRIILGTQMLSAYAQEMLRLSRYKKPTRYFQDVHDAFFLFYFF